jgi:hypothetical protein
MLLVLLVHCPWPTDKLVEAHEKRATALRISQLMLRLAPGGRGREKNERSSERGGREGRGGRKRGRERTRDRERDIEGDIWRERRREGDRARDRDREVGALPSCAESE